jgi:phosphocarrier protein FPr
VVGVVIVSHSHTLAEGVAELARGMGADEVRIATAGGLDEPGHPLGTDAARVMAAIEEAWSDDGVLVLMDLGSAVMSAEMAIDFLPEDRRDRVLLCDAPLAEGAVAAVVSARLGQSLAEVAAEARRGLDGKSSHLGTGTGAGAPVEPAMAEIAPEDMGGEGEEVEIVVDNVLGLHARPAARLVQTAGGFDAVVTVENLTGGRGPVPARSLNAVATLGVRQGHRIRVRAVGADAGAVLAAMTDLAADNFGDPPDSPTSAAAPPAPIPMVPTTEGAITGLPASPGIAVGPARHLRPREIVIPDTAVTDPDAEVAALHRALAETRADIARSRDAVSARGAGYEAAIFDAHLLFLDDPALVEPAERAIRDDGRTAARAWSDASSRLRAEWESVDDDYLRERAGDVDSVAHQVVAHLLGGAGPDVTIDDEGVLIARELTPADTAALDTRLVRGVATAAGGPTGHSAILARALGIPAVVGLGEAVLAIAESTELILDGEAGTLAVAPPPEAVAEATHRAAERREQLARSRERAAAPAVTRDGVTIEVAANLGSPADAAEAVAAGADGVGLFRTEFAFLDSPSPPTQAEQEAAYRALGEGLGGRPVTVRTLDAGSDKPLPFLDQPAEANPALGVRGVRLGLARPDILATQLRALLRVAVDVPLRIMFPMVATLEELRAARRAVDEAAAGLPDPNPEWLEVGIMVEVPAAAINAAALAREADFFSIGTNDLAQYTLAADRTNASVAGLADALHPAVLDLIGRTARAGAAHGRWVGVCGEVAGNPAATPILLGLGVRELSMVPAAIPAVKDAVRAVDLASAEALAAEALTLESASEVRALLTR